MGVDKCRISVLVGCSGCQRCNFDDISEVADSPEYILCPCVFSSCETVCAASAHWPAVIDFQCVCECVCVCVCPAGLLNQF